MIGLIRSKRMLPADQIWNACVVGWTSSVCSKRGSICVLGSHEKDTNFKPTCHHFDLPFFSGPFLFQSTSAKAMWSALFVTVDTANVQILLEVEGPTFYFCFVFKCHNWMLMGSSLFSDFFFSFAESHYCLCQTENWAVGWWPFLAC